MPPLPRCERMSYGPRRELGANATDVRVFYARACLLVCTEGQVGDGPGTDRGQTPACPRNQRQASIETCARSEPLIIFHAPCVSPPATTMLISDGSKIVITSSGCALSRDAYGSTP